MNYKYKRNQFWKKRLPVSKEIRAKVYDSRLSYRELIEYDLVDKVPVECLERKDRELVQKFGVDKLRELDWEMYDKSPNGYHEVLMELEDNPADINLSFYQAIVDIAYNPTRNSIYLPSIRPDNVTDKFKENMSAYFVDDLDIPEEVKTQYYQKNLSIFTIMRYWEQLKDKHLHSRLEYYSKAVDVDKFKMMMSEYPELSGLFTYTEEIVRLTEELYSVEKAKNDKDEIVKVFCTTVLEGKSDELDPSSYKVIFKYVDPNTYLKEKMDYLRHNSHGGNWENYTYDYDEFALGLDGMTIQEVIDAGFPPSILLDDDALDFIKIYGIKNIVEFDQECGQIFSKNNFAILKSMYGMYLHYGHDSFKPRPWDQSDRPYTREEFYSAMKSMIANGPTDGNYKGVSIDYRDITGPFREYAAELFIDENLPEELKTAFYTKQLEPSMVRDNPKLIAALRGKDLASCFKYQVISVRQSDSIYGHGTNAYEYLSNLAGYDQFMDFLVKNSDLFQVVCDHYYNLAKYKNLNDFTVDATDSFDIVVEKMVDKVYEIIVSTNVKYNPQMFSLVREKYPAVFIIDTAPQELQDKFYNREIDFELLQNHPEYIEHLQGVDVRVIFKPMTYSYTNKYGRYKNVDIVEEISKCFGDESLTVLATYGHLIEISKKNNSLKLNFDDGYSKEELLDSIEDSAYEVIKKGETKYGANMPKSFKDKYPTLFLPDNAPQELQDMFYNRILTIDVIKKDMSLLTYFENTDIALGFPLRLSWLVGTFNGVISEETTMKKLKIIEAYSKIADISLQDIFANFVKGNVETIDVNRLEELTDILYRLSFSNSSEMLAFRTTLATQILANPNPSEALDRVEEIFLTNNIPVPGKIYSVFQILHPHCEGFDFNNGCVSPVLSQSGRLRRDAIIFADLLRVSLGSNNRSMRDYLASIENGNNVFMMIANGTLKVEELDSESMLILKEYAAHLCALYNNTMKAKASDSKRVLLTDDIVLDINNLITLFSANGELDYNLPDRIISMYGHFAGIDTFESAKQYFIERRVRADERNRTSTQGKFSLEPGDLVKGINDFRFLHNILQNGSVAKEFLGDCATSDATPLDTDLSMIYEAKDTLEKTLASTEASSYGNIWLVLKQDDRFTITRNSSSAPTPTTDEVKHDPDKLELFFTGAAGGSHYGIRTGFASSDINYIIVANYDRRIGLEIAMNGFYIPVVDKEGKVVFTPEDYDLLRSKMSGLSYYDEASYTCSSYLETEETIALAEQIPESDIQVGIKRASISRVIAQAISSLDLSLKEHIDGDLTEGSVELIDTGSTGRGTNMPGDGDFDFMMRLDKSIFTNPSKLQKLKDTLMSAFGSEHASEVIGTGDFRLKGVHIDGLAEPVDIDITFVEKTSKLTYSTDMALQDRLSSIKKQNPDEYNLVIANILLAKKVLKEAGVYKPNRGEVPQGGLGGVGVENWILQHNGSFVEAAKSFLAAAEGRSFTEFCQVYQLWDFGENHLAEKRGKYSHDNFVTGNMSEEGYKKMCEVLKEYLNKLQYQSTDTKKIS